MPRWLLPEYIADVLPSEARRIEELRRNLLDLYRSYGYEMVMPPLIEHLDSLLVGSASDLGTKTFQLVDQLSGRTLGLRADITPQVARIDAHLLGRKGITRLCYAGSVLHTRPSGLLASREPMHVGAELYGHAGWQADLEVLDLVVRSLQVAQCSQVRIDLSHAGIVPALLAAAGEQGQTLLAEQDQLYSLLQTKDGPGLAQWIKPMALPGAVAKALLALPGLYGAAEPTLGKAREVFAPVGSSAIDLALEDVSRLIQSPLWGSTDTLQAQLALDFADLRGYRYHTGVFFAAYVQGMPDAVVRGGRYDNVGKVFGRARPATGFSLELRELAAMQVQANQQVDTPTFAIRAPWSDDAQLLAAIKALRSQGEVVIQSLPGQAQDQQEFACNRELRQAASGQWQVIFLS
jgi:ATP phosphoribosyltransferase regulatory subunit